MGIGRCGGINIIPIRLFVIASLLAVTFVAPPSAATANELNLVEIDAVDVGRYVTLVKETVDCTTVLAFASVAPTNKFAGEQVVDTTAFASRQGPINSKFVTDSKPPVDKFTVNTLAETTKYAGAVRSDVVGATVTYGVAEALITVVFVGEESGPVLTWSLATAGNGGTYAADTIGNAGPYSSTMLVLTGNYLGCVL